MKLCEYKDKGITIEIYQFELMDERMYVVKERKEAFIIDPYEEVSLKDTLRDIEKINIFITHEHFDHFSGVNWLKKQFVSNVTVYSSDICANIMKSKNNKTEIFTLFFIRDKKLYQFVKHNYTFPCVCEADVTFLKKKSFYWQKHKVEMFVTQGHSPGSSSMLLDSKYLFAGDALLGNGQELKSIDACQQDFLETINKFEKICNSNIMVFPGHGDYKQIKIIINKIKEFYGWN